MKVISFLKKGILIELSSSVKQQEGMVELHKRCKVWVVHPLQKRKLPVIGNLLLPKGMGSLGTNPTPREELNI